MSSSSIRLALAFLLPLMAVAIASGQADTSDETAAAWNPPPATEAVRDLQREFSNLYQSLRNNFGLQESELGTVREFRQRITQQLQDDAENPYLIAMNLQLSMWLKDDDRVDESFRKLLMITGDSERYGQAWARYFRTRGDVDRLTGIYETLLEMNPDDEQIRMSWAEQLKQEGRFATAIEVLEQTEWSVVDDPSRAITVAEIQMGLHRFEDAVATLDGIPESAFENKGSLKPRVDLIKGQARQYIDLWTAEQELRAAEAAADDLPRVAIETDRGRVVIELLEDQAPNTVANFVKLSRDGYYDGTIFHRRIPGTIVMGGDTVAEDGTSTGNSNPGYRIQDEHIGETARRHFTGSVAMHKGGQRDSGASIFYLTYKPLPERNGRYTVFGRVIEGEDVLSTYRKDDVITSITVLRTRDHEYEPVTIPLNTEPVTGLTPAPTTPE